MTNYNLIVPIKDDFQSKQVLKQSPGVSTRKETETTGWLCLRQRCSAGCWACWQLQRIHRHAEQTSTELLKM